MEEGLIGLHNVRQDQARVDGEANELQDHRHHDHPRIIVLPLVPVVHDEDLYDLQSVDVNVIVHLQGKDEIVTLVPAVPDLRYIEPVVVVEFFLGVICRLIFALITGVGRNQRVLVANSGDFCLVHAR